MKFYADNTNEVIVMMRSVFDEDLGVLRCLCELRRLSIENNENRLRIIKTDGIEDIHAAILRHANESELAVDILVAASNLLCTLISYNGNSVICYCRYMCGGNTTVDQILSRLTRKRKSLRSGFSKSL